MKKTLLKFPSVIYLISFRRYSRASYWEIDLTERTILCNCSKKEQQVACSDFRAEILPLPEKMKLLEPENVVPPTELRLELNAKAS
jgi:hypothetical protein